MINGNCSTGTDANKLLIKFQFIEQLSGVLLVVLTSLYAPFSRSYTKNNEWLVPFVIFLYKKRAKRDSNVGAVLNNSPVGC